MSVFKIREFIVVCLFIYFFNIFKISIYANNEDLLQVGKTLYLKGKYEQAISALQSASFMLTQSDKQYEIHFYLALSYYMIEDSKYIEEFKNAIKVNSFKDPDPKIISPKIIKIYNKIKKDIINKEGQLNLMFSSSKQYLVSDSKNKSLISLEYKVLTKDMENITSNKSDTAIYQTQFLKYEYNFVDFFSSYLAAGTVKFALPEKYGSVSPGFEGGAKMNIHFLENFNMDFNANYLRFINKLNESNNEMNWREMHIGATIRYKYSYFMPYMGIYKTYISSIMESFSGNTLSNSTLFEIKNKNNSNEIFAGIGINIKNLFLTAEIYPNRNSNKNFKFGLGSSF